MADSKEKNEKSTEKIIHDWLILNESHGGKVEVINRRTPCGGLISSTPVFVQTICGHTFRTTVK